MKGQTLGAAVKLLVFALVTIVATAVLAIVISNQTFGATRSFRADFTDATALIPGDDVRIAGVRVGTVGSVHIVTAKGTNGPERVAQVSFSVDKSVPVTTSTDVAINYQNLIGQRYVALQESTGNGTAQPPKQVIPLSRTTPALDLTALFNGFKPLFTALTPKDVNSFATDIVETLQGEGGSVTNLVEQSATLTNTVADRDAAIGQVIDNLVSVLGTVRSRTAGLNELIDQLTRLVGGLAQDRATIAASLSGIDDLNSNSATFIKSIRPYLPTDLTKLSTITKTLNTTKDCPGYFSSQDNTVNVAAVPKFANNNCDGPNTLNEYLHRAPGKINQLTRTGSYGGYFNFYLCKLSLGGETGTFLQTLTGSAEIDSDAAACQ